MKSTFSFFLSGFLCFVLLFTNGNESNAGTQAEKTPAAEVAKVDALTFRILASRIYPEDAEIIEQAEKTAEKEIMDSTGKVLLARWVPVAESESNGFDDENIIRRKKEKMLEVLVKFNDGIDITGEYLTDIGQGIAMNNDPAITFQFNAVGADKLGRLTGDNLPNLLGNTKRHLGIILNCNLYSAPVIMDRVQGRGIISFQRRDTEEERKKLSQEIDDLIKILRSGALPNVK